MKLDLAQVPFSRYGSYLAIDRLAGNEHRVGGIYLRTLHGDATCAEVCRIELLCEGLPVEPVIDLTPSALLLTYHSHSLAICFSNNHTLLFQGQGLGVRLHFDAALYDSAMQWRDAWLINRFSNRMRYVFASKNGALLHRDVLPDNTFDALPDASGNLMLALAEALLACPTAEILFERDFSACRKEVEQKFSQWLLATPSVPAEFSAARELAAYVQWSSVVAAKEKLERSAMLMSKHWLNAVWSWDHCFNAMALLDISPALAWDQYMLLFDHQDEWGALPDCVSDKTMVWNFCKPPVHGWALRWMLQHGAVSSEQLSEIYAPLARWTQWWFDTRAADDELPQYFHGNDSGWDNASVFDAGVPVQSPDLAAFLVVQMDVLADIAQRLNDAYEVTRWQQRADNLLKKMLTHYWHNNRFVALHDRKPCAGDSLLLQMPIILGHRLPKSIRADLIAALKQDNRFLTQCGLASESIESELYESDGYWRGPMWAPAVFLIVESLRELGESAFADDIAMRFCKTVARSGMAENFDALTGEGLRDRAHTWTASVFLLLAANDKC
ncbi:MAG: trehalase family glycosidase [Spongiibacteraceae bacterium]